LKGEGESCFVEDNMAGDDDSIGGEVKTPVTLVIRRVADEHTQSSAWGKFVGSSGSEVWVAGAPESSEIVVGGMGAMKCEVGGAHV
jgi:hypothetical protein